MFHQDLCRGVAGRVMLCLVLSCGVQGAAWSATWYVAPGGNGHGSAAAPFGSIQAAADVTGPGDLVLVAPGVYRETVRVTHSGTAAAPIVFRSQQPGAAVVSGADPVGVMTPGGHNGYWRSGAVTPFASGIGQGEQCFAGRTRLEEARWPHTAADALSSPAFAVMSQVVNLAPIAYDNFTQMHTWAAMVVLDRGVLPQADWTGAQIRVSVGRGFDEVGGVVTGIASVTGLPTVLIIQYHTQGELAAPGNDFYLYGVPAALSAPGQWLRSGQSLLVRAPGDADPNHADIECKQRDFAFDLSGQSYVTLDGFGIFAASVTTDHDSGDTSGGRAGQTLHAGQGSVAAAGHIVLEALQVDTPNSIRDLTGNTTSQWTNNTGVVLSGSDNLLQHSSITHADGNGVSLAGVGNKVLHNRISESDLAGCECAGISTGYRGVMAAPHPTPRQWAWTWNLGDEIGYNVIERSGRALINISSLASTAAAPSRVHHNILSGAVLQTYDDGAIYSTQFPYETARVPQAGLEIDHNIITASPVAIYLDNYSSGFLVHHNIASAPGEPGLTDSVMLINSGSGHRIFNNTFVAESADSESIDDPTPTVDDAGTLIRNNILRGATVADCLPACRDHSLVWDGIPGSPTDPRFQNAAAANFALLPNSPAIDAGVFIPGISDDSRPGSQHAGSRPDAGAIDSGSPTWEPGTAGDATAPTITLSTPAEGATYLRYQTVHASYSCSDAGSGIAHCGGSRRNREPLDTGSPGEKTFSVTATDRAGNTTTVARHYHVMF